MGRIKNGILGGVSGKVGAVVGASWRGIEYIRGLPRLSSKPATEAQIGQRCKLKLFREFLLAIDVLVEKGYQNYSKSTPMNAALSYNMLEAVTGTSPDFVIDFPNLLYCRGDLFGTWSPKAVSLESESLNFSWINGPYMPLCSGNDEVALVVYSTKSEEFVFFRAAALRQDKAAKLILPDYFSGSSVHCYLNFFSADGKLSSSNQYLGEVVVI